MRMGADRLDPLAAAVAKAAPSFDGEQQRIALEVYRRLAEETPAPGRSPHGRATTSVESALSSTCGRASSSTTTGA